jgi:hypothetical protein
VVPEINLAAVGLALRLLLLAAGEAVTAVVLVPVMAAALVAVIGLLAALVAVVMMMVRLGDGDRGGGRESESQDERRQKLLHDGAP